MEAMRITAVSCYKLINKLVLDCLFLAYTKCSQDHFKCDNGRCISKKWLCDMEDDCRDGSDEKNCPSVNPVTCGSTEFKCGGPIVQCIPNSWKCDGENDCKDGLDEKDCKAASCESWQFAVSILKYWPAYPLYFVSFNSVGINNAFSNRGYAMGTRIVLMDLMKLTAMLQQPNQQHQVLCRL
jgi:hypothetical protein